MSLSATKRQDELPELSDQAMRDLCQVFKLLADETRLRILIYLGREGELNVTELCERLEQSQPAVSHHLALMRVAGIIEPRRAGKHNYYSLREEHFQALLRTLLPDGAGKKASVRFHDFVLSYEGA
jgi:DNA-binding transcriptional ArsR family regulator